MRRKETFSSGLDLGCESTDSVTQMESVEQALQATESVRQIVQSTCCRYSAPDHLRVRIRRRLSEIRLGSSLAD